MTNSQVILNVNLEIQPTSKFINAYRRQWLRAIATICQCRINRMKLSIRCTEQIVDVLKWLEPPVDIVYPDLHPTGSELVDRLDTLSMAIGGTICPQFDLMPQVPIHINSDEIILGSVHLNYKDKGKEWSPVVIGGSMDRVDSPIRQWLISALKIYRMEIASGNDRISAEQKVISLLYEVIKHQTNYKKRIISMEYFHPYDLFNLSDEKLYEIIGSVSSQLSHRLSQYIPQVQSIELRLADRPDQLQTIETGYGVLFNELRASAVQYNPLVKGAADSELKKLADISEVLTNNGERNWWVGVCGKYPPDFSTMSTYMAWINRMEQAAQLRIRK